MVNTMTNVKLQNQASKKKSIFIRIHSLGKLRMYRFNIIKYCLLLFLLNCNTIEIKKIMFVKPSLENLKKVHIQREVCTNYLAFIDSPFTFYLFPDDKRGRRLEKVLKNVEKEFPNVKEWYDVEIVEKTGCLIFSGDYYE